MDSRIVDVVARSDQLERRLEQMVKTQTMNQATIMALREEISASKDKDGKMATSVTVGDNVGMMRGMEVKIASLEADLAAARRDAARWRDSRAGDVVELVHSARTRLAALVQEIGGGEGEEVMMGLVADNTLLRHDNLELANVLAEVRRDARALREEMEELKRGTPRIPTTTTMTPTTDNGFPRPLTLGNTHSRGYSLTPSLASVRSNPPPYTHGRQDSWSGTTSPRTGRREDSGWGVITEGEEGQHAREVSTSSVSSVEPTRRKRLSLTPSFRPPVSPLGEGYFPAAGGSGKGMCSVGVQTEEAVDQGPTLGGLGFEETSRRGSVAPDTPSSFGPTVATDNTASLLLLIDHTTKILHRVRQADVPTLTRRLRKQHLAGDVGHLSASTIKALSRDIADMRGYFRGVLDEEKRQPHIPTTTSSSLVARKDFMQLIKLFKELFMELVELRGTVNSVILDPGSVARLREGVQAAIDCETVEVKRPALGWIAPTIQKLFTGGAAEPVMTPAGRGPKLEPSTSASTTHVNVEFASTGIIRRSTLAEEDRPGTVEAKVRPRQVMTLGDGSVRGQRAGLMGIFAGAQQARPAGNTIRVKPSMEFNNPRRQGAHRRQISNAVDAVIDQPVPEDDALPPLLERTLRPRGLSDSSIRSTYQSHAMPARQPARTPPPASGSYWPDSKMVKTLGRRITAYTTVDVPTRPPVAVPGTLGAQNRSYMDMLAGTSPMTANSYSRTELER